MAQSNIHGHHALHGLHTIVVDLTSIGHRGEQQSNLENNTEKSVKLVISVSGSDLGITNTHDPQTGRKCRALDDIRRDCRVCRRSTEPVHLIEINQMRNDIYCRECCAVCSAQQRAMGAAA